MPKHSHTSLPAESFVDSHCHLDFFLDQRQPNLPNLTDVLHRAADANITTILTIATDLARQQHLFELCQTNDAETSETTPTSSPSLFCSAGTHPTYLTEETPPPSTEQLLAWHKAHPQRIIAFGESGLDFFRPQNPPARTQEISFRNHILAAQEAQIPLVIHNRAADEDIARILVETQKANPYPCILHCFAASQRLANIGLEIGCLLSFSGIVTYSSAQNLQPILRATPLDAMLLETDAPFLPPQSLERKKRPPHNEPSMLPITARHIAEVKGVSLAELAEATTRSFRKLFPQTKPQQKDTP